MEYDRIDEIPQNSLDHPRVVRARHGILAFGSDRGIGYTKPENEDGIVINTEKDAFAVVDGIGGEIRSKRAMEILTSEIQLGFSKNASFSEIHWNAHVRMNKEGISTGGASYIVARVHPHFFVQIGQAGDVKLVVMSNEKVVFATKDEGIGNVLYNYVTGTMHGHSTQLSAGLLPNDRIIIASDGLWKNFQPEEATQIIAGKSTKEAIETLNLKAKGKMVSGEGNPDNISIILYDLFT